MEPHFDKVILLGAKQTIRESPKVTIPTEISQKTERGGQSIAIGGGEESGIGDTCSHQSRLISVTTLPATRLCYLTPTPAAAVWWVSTPFCPLRRFHKRACGGAEQCCAVSHQRLRPPALPPPLS
ncbi:hypothetical protein MRX96_022528 [Rhipicephalus microplus]